MYEQELKEYEEDRLDTKEKIVSIIDTLSFTMGETALYKKLVELKNAQDNEMKQMMVQCFDEEIAKSEVHENRIRLLNKDYHKEGLDWDLSYDVFIGDTEIGQLLATIHDNTKAIQKHLPDYTFKKEDGIEHFDIETPSFEYYSTYCIEHKELFEEFWNEPLTLSKILAVHHEKINNDFYDMSWEWHKTAYGLTEEEMLEAHGVEEDDEYEHEDEMEPDYFDEETQAYFEQCMARED